jgi:hypothetical protein
MSSSKKCKLGLGCGGGGGVCACAGEEHKISAEQIGIRIAKFWAEHGATCL